MYNAKEDRYDTMHYRRSGKSGVKLPELSLGLWHNFGSDDDADAAESIVLHAFDRGITHFDLANNYGPPPGSAESFFGAMMIKNLRPFRDELIVSSKAGYGMWPGPYGDFGSRKYLVASCDQSLARMKLDYVDIFYHHRPDPDTPLEETMGALDYIVRSGRALYAGISNYGPDDAIRAIRILRELGTPCLIHQGNYSMLNRWVEDGLLDVLDREGVGGIWYSPLAQGLLTGRYLDGSIPDGSRASRSVFLKPERLTPALLAKLNALASIAGDRGETLSRLAIKWLLRHRHTTSVLIGASSVAQLDENLLALEGAGLSDAELNKIETILAMPE
ncbi:MAG TPA: aldo/keto reductase [Treponemataceae bacterium]|nr:aldo/keto reductase [Treponemataceae bacterium]HOS35353.1 aldo/keto reductase [Treponemataceae bacterium]HOU38382.1 aldo/keto reductase [Treponemataceae bacterium]HPL91451.1 aldo/keto reductase [Treponemataceae bacterium]HQF73409.1 aldo/keto reductase [Treponemataceae bacterium]